MTFKDKFIIAVISALLPSIVVGAVSLFTYSYVSVLDEKVKSLESDTRALELYNQLSPNTKFTLSNMIYGASYKYGLDLTTSNGYSSEDFMLFIESAKENPTKENILYALEEIESRFNKINESSREIVTFNYCSENRGSVEVFVDKPTIKLHSSGYPESKPREVESITNNPIGIIPPGGTSCNSVAIPYGNIPKSEFEYSLEFNVEPSFRSIKFMYKNKSDDEIKKIIEQFLFTYKISGKDMNDVRAYSLN